jgi:chromosome segregation ATPase
VAEWAVKNSELREEKELLMKQAEESAVRVKALEKHVRAFKWEGEEHQYEASKAREGKHKARKRLADKTAAHQADREQLAGLEEQVQTLTAEKAELEVEKAGLEEDLADYRGGRTVPKRRWEKAKASEAETQSSLDEFLKVSELVEDQRD